MILFFYSIQVDEALANINDPRIRGVIHWQDVESNPHFRKVLANLEAIMKASPADSR